MYSSILIVITSLLSQCHGQVFQSTCTPTTPFKTKNNNCANFNNVCVKKDDLECINFLSACNQCPATNETIFRWYKFANVSHELIDIIRFYKDQSNSTIQNLEYRLNKTKAEMDLLAENFKRLKVTSLLLLIIIIVLLALMILLMFVELRFKLITKKYEETTGKGKKINYRHWKKKKYSQLQADDDPYQRIRQIIDEKLKDLKKWDVKTKPNNESDFVTPHVTIHIAEMEKTIDLPVHTYDNTIKIKRKLCAKLDNVDPDFYKMIKLKHKDVVLDDNEYLIKNVPSLDGYIECFADNAIHAKDIVVIKLEGNRRLPEYLQLQTNQTIREIKAVISQFCSETFAIFKGHEARNELKDGSTVTDCGLVDDGIMRAIAIESGSLHITFVLEDKEAIVIKYTNTDTVESLKNKIALDVKKTTEQFFLFHNCQYIEDRIFLFDCGIRDQDEIKYCSLTNLDNFQIESYGTPGEISQISKRINKTSKQEIMMKEYSFESSEDLWRNKGLMKELSKYQKMKMHPIFVKLHGVSIKNNILQISMEYVKGKSMKDIVDISFPIPEKDISRWTKDILHGLQHLHKENEIYRYLKSTNILRDKDMNIRLSSFGLSKYIHGIDSKEMSTGLYIKNPSKFRFIAPEVMNRKPFTKSTDIWLLGENMLKMVTGKGAYSTKSLINAMNDINGYQNVDYEYPKQGMSENLISFLDRSLKGDPDERPTIEQLLNDKFLTTSH